MAKKKEESATEKAYQVHFGVEIPETKKKYTKEEIEASEEICEYLVSIGSGAVTKL